MSEATDLILLPPELTKLRIFTSGEVGNEKISVTTGEMGQHYTLHFGSRSKFLDVHVKDEKTGEYQRIFGMSHYSLMRLYAGIWKFVNTGIRRYFLGNRINLGKLKKLNCILVKVGGEEELFSSFIREKRKGRFSKSYKFQDSLDRKTYDSLFLYPDEIFETKCTYFDVYKLKNGYPRKIGNVMKDPRNPQSRNLFFISKENWRMFQATLDLSMLTAIEKIQGENKDMMVSKMRAYMGKQYSGTTIIKRLKDDIKKRPTNSLKPVWNSTAVRLNQVFK